VPFLEHIYQEAKAAWVPDAADNPDNHWFYSSWAGLSAVFAALHGDVWQHHAVVHQALCWSQGEWPALCTELRRALPQIPERPKRPLSHDQAPVRTPERAREIFERQFRNAFPGKRLNSTFAKQKWEEVKAKAEKLADDEFLAALAAWTAREQARDKIYQEALSAWYAARDRITQLTQIVAALETTEVDNDGV